MYRIVPSDRVHVVDLLHRLHALQNARWINFRKCVCDVRVSSFRKWFSCRLLCNLTHTSERAHQHISWNNRQLRLQSIQFPFQLISRKLYYSRTSLTSMPFFVANLKLSSSMCARWWDANAYSMLTRWVESSRVMCVQTTHKINLFFYEILSRSAKTRTPGIIHDMDVCVCVFLNCEQTAYHHFRAHTYTPARMYILIVENYGRTWAEKVCEWRIIFASW